MNRRDFLKSSVWGGACLFNLAFGEDNVEINSKFDVGISTYLGCPQRKYYGEGSINNLEVIKKYNLGSGITRVGKEIRNWSGAGWTGQPLIVSQEGVDYIIIGSYSHNLHKIRREDFQPVWKYEFDDVIKGTGTIIQTNGGLEVIQGSRRGFNKNLSSMDVPSLRAINFETGEEIWRKNIERTRSYSRDVDSSALDLSNGEIFIPGENSIGYFLDNQGREISRVNLFEEGDSKVHGGNLVCESSPARFEDMIYVASGSGHVYGIDVNDKKIVWRHTIGSDLDGTLSIDETGKLYCAIEKQYIPGRGGVMKLNPKSQDPIEWFMHTQNRKFVSWEGGIIGSVALNDRYRKKEDNHLFATLAIDGNLYLGSQTETTGDKVTGPDAKTFCETPRLFFSERLAPSISTPIFCSENKIIAPTYNGVFLLQYSGINSLDVKILDHALKGRSFEATPVVWDNKVYVASRDGFLYELGN
jgi:outer membrane protein assembly factor BamB